jgi:2-oxoglutarate ferredoxin oxidoreductase subunit gamma
MHDITPRTNIRLAGFGGQGVVLAGVLLGQAAVFDGLYAAGSNSYGAQARGSACKAEVVISQEPIDYPLVELADLFVGMSQGGYDAFKDKVAPDGFIFYDSGLLTPSHIKKRQHGVNVSGIALETYGHKQVGNMIWVGILARFNERLSDEAIEQAVRQHTPERFLELNLQALARGLELGSALGEN